jgi:4-amino-4-deoxy-L-arabinose transferase-like glycosyltransferase
MPHDAPSPTLSSPRVLALAALVLHAIPTPGFAIHRDTFLYYAMGDHLNLLRMQFPPFVAIAARGTKTLFGASTLGARVLPALGHATMVLITAALARRLGGGWRAQWLAALTALLGPLFVRTGLLFQPVIFDLVWGSLATLALVHLLAGDDRRWWLVLGVAAGLGTLTKFSVAFWGLGVAATIALSSLRRDLATRWPWVAVAIAAVLGAPSITGQIFWHWPFFAQMDALRQAQLGRVTPSDFLASLALQVAGAAPLLVIGVVWLLRRGTFRAAGIGALTTIVALMAAHGKGYYAAPMLPLLVAAGSVGFERWSVRVRRPTLLFAAASSMIVVINAPLLPLGTPVLPPRTMARYVAALGLRRAVTTNVGTRLPLPQDYADMIGWQEQVAAVAKVFHALPDSDQARAAIFGDNYGRAGALALYGPRFGLPYPISRSGDFYAWGPGTRPGEPFIVVGSTKADLQQFFGSVTLAAVFHHDLMVAEEREVGIYVCRAPKAPLPELWRQLGVDWS